MFDVQAKNFPYSEIMNKLKLTEGFPVVNLIAAASSSRGKFYAGVARACFNCDAVIVDSAIETGIEPYAMRKGKNEDFNKKAKNQRIKKEKELY